MLTGADLTDLTGTLPCGHPATGSLFPVKGVGETVILTTAYTDGEVLVPATAWCTEGDGWVPLTAAQYVNLDAYNEQLATAGTGT